MMSAATLLAVCPDVDLWKIRQEGCKYPLASFQSRSSAMIYAVALAETKPHAQVLVFDDRGELSYRFDHN